MWRLLVLVAGCSFSAGPVIGYGQRGFVLGGEAGGGMRGFEATAGYAGGQRYARLDYAAPSDYRSFDGTAHALGRVGLGAALSPSLRWNVMAVAGAGALRSTANNAEECVRTETDANVLSATVELRYVGYFEIVVVPRYQWVSSICPGR